MWWVVVKETHVGGGILHLQVSLTSVSAASCSQDYLGDSGSDHSCLLLAKIQEVNQCLEKLFAGARKVRAGSGGAPEGLGRQELQGGSEGLGAGVLRGGGLQGWGITTKHCLPPGQHPPMLPPGPGPGPPCPTVEEAGVSAANAVGAARAEPLAHQGEEAAGGRGHRSSRPGCCRGSVHGQLHCGAGPRMAHGAAVADPRWLPGPVASWARMADCCQLCGAPVGVMCWARPLFAMAKS